jgi:hypothetical protein
VSLTLTAPPGGLATAWVTANGVQLGRWTVENLQSVSAKPAYVAPSGGDVVLEWYLKSSSTTVKAEMKLLSYDYDITEADVPPVVVEPEIQACVMMVCKSLVDAEALAVSLKEIVGNIPIEVYSKA